MESLAQIIPLCIVHCTKTALTKNNSTSQEVQSEVLEDSSLP